MSTRYPRMNFEPSSNETQKLKQQIGHKNETKTEKENDMKVKEEMRDSSSSYTSWPWKRPSRGRASRDGVEGKSWPVASGNGHGHGHGHGDGHGHGSWLMAGSVDVGLQLWPLALGGVDPWGSTIAVSGGYVIPANVSWVKKKRAIVL